MKILKDQSAQTTTRAVGIAYRLWLLNHQSAQLNKVKEHYIYFKPSCRQTDNLQPGTTIIQKIYIIMVSLI